MQVKPNPRLRPYLYVLALMVAPLGVALSQSASTERKPEASKTNILFIGNSYSFYNDLPGVLTRLAKANGQQVHVEIIARNGASLQQHWQEGAAVKALKKQRWDFVVLQERSSLIRERLDQTQNYARLFQSEIEKTGAKTLLYVTPAYKDQMETQDATNEGYGKIAEDIQAITVPVGLAFQTVFDRIPEIELHASDNVHPNPKGTLLAAYVFYMTIFADTFEQMKKPDSGIELDSKEETIFRTAAADVIRRLNSQPNTAN